MICSTEIHTFAAGATDKVLTAKRFVIGSIFHVNADRPFAPVVASSKMTQSAAPVTMKEASNDQNNLSVLKQWESDALVASDVTIAQRPMRTRLRAGLTAKQSSYTMQHPPTKSDNAHGTESELAGFRGRCHFQEAWELQVPDDIDDAQGMRTETRHSSV